ncbi:Type II secretion system (T2SS), protein F [Eubacterium uniforme]|uniref:Type II secretion system (T2SS), protein F n=1 Tax=Eubacterium uniforme TaxID=39495 RepID=A0A1T4VR89_9FIRM|nr:type II secretion system F family protein [Eubacterium uniforme]SKA67476.1 Type II secretion system (T2SS), protein F [Eubacterium uniforme]
MSKVISVFIILILIFFIATFRYKNKFLKGANKKEYKLYVILGSGLFIVDLIPKKIIKPYIRKLANKYRQIYVTSDVKNKCYLYVAEKICESLICLILVLMFVVVYLLKSSGGEDIKRIKRPSEDMPESKYYLTADGDIKENINLLIGSKEYTKKEAYKLFDKRKGDCIKRMLNKNESLDKVNTSLNIEDVEYSDGMLAQWQVQGEVINYDGSINIDVIDSNKVSSEMILTISYKDFSKDYKVDITVGNVKQSIQDKVQNYIDEQDRTSDYVVLPEELDEEKIGFRSKKNILWIFILGIGVLYAFAMFFLRDLDIKDKLRDRHEEMVSDYPKILNKFALLLRAGLGNVKALERIILEYDARGEYRYAYEEIKYMLYRIRLGEGEEKAYENYAKRCNEMCYSKFAGMLAENLRRGNLNLGDELSDELNKAWKERENVLRIKGERVGTKLVIPMILILIITLVMIVVPAFMSMKGV